MTTHEKLVALRAIATKEILRFARIWGASVFDGQQVGADHVVEDGDIVELHTHEPRTPHH